MQAKRNIRIKSVQKNMRAFTPGEYERRVSKGRAAESVIKKAFPNLTKMPEGAPELDFIRLDEEHPNKEKVASQLNKELS